MDHPYQGRESRAKCSPPGLSSGTVVMARPSSRDTTPSTRSSPYPQGPVPSYRGTKQPKLRQQTLESPASHEFHGEKTSSSCSAPPRAIAASRVVATGPEGSTAVNNTEGYRSKSRARNPAIAPTPNPSGRSLSSRAGRIPQDLSALSLSVNSKALGTPRITIRVGGAQHSAGGRASDRRVAARALRLSPECQETKSAGGRLCGDVIALKAQRLRRAPQRTVGHRPPCPVPHNEAEGCHHPPSDVL